METEGNQSLKKKCKKNVTIHQRRRSTRFTGRLYLMLFRSRDWQENESNNKTNPVGHNLESRVLRRDLWASEIKVIRPITDPLQHNSKEDHEELRGIFGSERSKGNIYRKERTNMEIKCLIMTFLSENMKQMLGYDDFPRLNR